MLAKGNLILLHGHNMGRPDANTIMAATPRQPMMRNRDPRFHMETSGAFLAQISFSTQRTSKETSAGNARRTSSALGGWQ
jgi:hypothetical protein